MQSRLHRKDRFLIRYAVSIAASVIIFVSSAIYVIVTKSYGYRGAVETSQSVEFCETEQYYSEQAEKSMEKLKQAISAQPGNVTSQLIAELEEMEKSYQQLKNDLKNNPDDIRLMSAIVQYHQLRLDFINNLTERFTLYSNTKIKQHENKNI
ncbi:MAG: hypothetical protein HC905_27155 [Bacteroidales bacterium]|nr:hypothetical protein [Bacteroidales bacterium]